MAAAVARWLRTGVARASMKLGVLPRELIDLDSYACRTRDGLPGAKLSEHGRANALDVRAFEMSNDETFVLADPKVPKAWRQAVRAAACARFSTVLGPGADSYHARHVHIDLAVRRNHYKICEWDVRVPAPAAGRAASRAVDAVPLPRPRPVAAGSSRRSTILPRAKLERGSGRR